MSYYGGYGIGGWNGGCCYPRVGACYPNYGCGVNYCNPCGYGGGYDGWTHDGNSD